MTILLKRHYLLLIGTILLALGLTGCNKPAPKKERPIVTVEAIKVEPTNVPISKSYIGITSSVSSVDIRARVKGFLVKKNFEEGGFVKKNQLLFEIDPNPFKAALQQAQAQLANALANVNFQKVEYQRMKALYAKNVVSKERFDKAATTYKQGLAKVAQEEADVENAKINLSYCYMYSPIDGRIGKTQVDVGNLVGGTQDTLLATVVELNPIYVEFSPSVSDFGEFIEYKKQGKPFKVTAYLPKYPKETFTGEVSLVNNQADTKTATVLMRATLKNPEKLLLPGLYVNVDLMLKKDNKALTVPEAAIINGQGIVQVNVIGKNNIIQTQTITSNLEYKGQVVISSGLKAGEVVVTSNLEQIQSGDKVNYTLNNNNHSNTQK